MGNNQILAKGWTFEYSLQMANQLLLLFISNAEALFRTKPYWNIQGGSDKWDEGCCHTSKAYDAQSSAKKALKHAKRIFPDIEWELKPYRRVDLVKGRATLLQALTAGHVRSYINTLKQRAEAEFARRARWGGPSEQIEVDGRPQRISGLRYLLQNPWEYGETSAEYAWVQCQPIYQAFPPIQGIFKEFFRLDAGLASWAAEEPIQGPVRPAVMLITYTQEKLGLEGGMAMANANLEELKCDVG